MLCKIAADKCGSAFFFWGGGGGGGGMAGGKKIKLDISCELSSLIKFFFPEKEKIIYSNFT